MKGWVLIVIYNFLFSFACLWVARMVWRFRCKLIRISDTILAAEQSVHRVLYPAPEKVLKAQSSTQRLRDRYQQLGVKYERVRQILAFLNLVQVLLRFRWLVLPRAKVASSVLKKTR